MVLSALEKLQKRSEGSRRRIAIGTALVITAVVTGVWFMTLSARFETASAGAPQGGNEPFAIIGGELRKNFEKITKQFGSLELPQGSGSEGLK